LGGAVTGSGADSASYHGALPAGGAWGAGAPGAIPPENTPAPGKRSASEDEYWQRPAD
jgi:hypothetical protein